MLSAGECRFLIMLGSPLGDGEREERPSARAGLPIERRTVSSVRSIFRSERASTSCFLGLRGSNACKGCDPNADEAKTHLLDRLPRFDSSKMHSWLPVLQRLHGGPLSAPSHFIFSRRQTVHALLGSREHTSRSHSYFRTHLAPRVVFVFCVPACSGTLSSSSSTSSSCRALLRAASAAVCDPLAGRLPPLAETEREGPPRWSEFGVGAWSEPCESGDEMRWASGPTPGW